MLVVTRSNSNAGEIISDFAKAFTDTKYIIPDTSRANLRLGRGSL